MDFRLRSQFVCFMTTACVLLMSWTFFDSLQEYREKHDTCECVCIDPAQVKGRLQYRSVYTGYRSGETCKCEDFLLTALREQMLPFRDANSTCRYCDCGDVHETDCQPNGEMSYRTILQIVTVTFMLISCFMWMDVGFQTISNSGRSVSVRSTVERVNLLGNGRGRTRNGYESLVDQTNDIYDL